MEEQEPWHLTVILLEGLRHMRPEKVWRPIITVEVDKHHIHETTLGVDGQNVNQKECFKLHEVTPSTKVELKVWHRSQSKKKKRMVLVAEASHCLGELLKKQNLESKLEIRLQCRNADRKSTTSSRGRPQNGAILRLKLRAPPIVEKDPSPEAFEGLWSSDDDSMTDSDDSVSIATDVASIGESSKPLLPAPERVLRRRVRGYIINSDDEAYSTDAGAHSETERLLDDNSFSYVGDDEEKHSHHPHALVIHQHSQDIICLSELADGEMSASNLPLPLYTEKITVPPDMSRGESILASFTMYGELSSARTDDHFEAVFRRLQHEWTYIGGLLAALAAVNTAVFSISPDSIMPVNSYARNAVAASSVASGLGIACDAWFLLRYNWADLGTFIIRARDLYGSYFFFSLSARVPALCMFISAVSLMGFLGLVAFDAWPQGVLVVCFLVGIVMSMQFLVYGVHIAARTVANGGRAGGRQVVRAVGVVRSMTG